MFRIVDYRFNKINVDIKYFLILLNMSEKCMWKTITQKPRVMCGVYEERSARILVGQLSL
jgi:hypothetical protein